MGSGVFNTLAGYFGSPTKALYESKGLKSTYPLHGLGVEKPLDRITTGKSEQELYITALFCDWCLFLVKFTPSLGGVNMALIACVECGGKRSDSAANCPHCGAAIALAAATVSKKSGGIWRWVVGVPLGLFVFVMVLGTTNSDPEKTTARNAYKMCLGNLEANDRARAGNGNFIAGACEMMRNDFIKKYGTTP